MEDGRMKKEEGRMKNEEEVDRKMQSPTMIWALHNVRWNREGCYSQQSTVNSQQSTIESHELSHQA